MSTESIVIVSAKRTPLGAFQGIYQNMSSTQLGSVALKGALEAGCVEPDHIDEVLMGCVLPAGLGQAPARQAALGAGLLKQTACVTINKVCGSGLKSVMLAHDLIKAGSAEIILAGGMESMTNAPYLLPKAREGMRIGHQEVLDHMMLDGLQDAYSNRTPMGVFAEATAEKYGFTREDQDAFAIESGKRALKAMDSGAFKDEICPVEIAGRNETLEISQDEPPSKIKFDKIPTLKPAFKKDGTLTAANSSSISDGAAAVLLMTESRAKELGLKPLARIVAHAQYSREPEWFTLAPVGAIERVLEKAKWTQDQVDLFEINEAFAVVTMAAMKDLKLDHKKVNVHGGACALGHPIGASGARILVTLLHALKSKQKGIASLCIGGGEAVAMAVEKF